MSIRPSPHGTVGGCFGRNQGTSVQDQVIPGSQKYINSLPFAHGKTKFIYPNHFNMTITVGVIGATGTTGGMVVDGLLSSSTDFVS